MKRFGKILYFLSVYSIFGLFIYLAFCIAAPNGIYAQDCNWVDCGYGNAMRGARKGGSVANEPYTKKTQNNMYLGIVEDILGSIKGLTDATNDPEYNRMMTDRSILSTANRYIAAIYDNPPASTYAFLQDMGQTLGFFPKRVYAQGLGFAGLASILPLWKAFRNIAYALLAIVMIVIGFMVMLRKKIDPKTVVTVQNALPRIIVTLFLITFSYAIVGILIDLMYVVIFFAVGIFESSGLLPPVSVVNTIFGIHTHQQLYGSGTLIQNMNEAVGNISIWHLFGVDAGWWEDKLLTGLATIAGLLALTSAIPFIGIGTGILLLSVPLLAVLLSLFILFLIIRLLFLFVGAYVQIVIALLIGPFQLLLEAVPGSSSFSSWLKNLIANISVFPVAAVMFMLSSVFAHFASGGGDLWSPPYTGFFSSATAIAGIMSLGFLFAIPTVAASIKEALKAKPPIQAGPGAIISPMVGTVQTGVSTLSQFWMGGQALGAGGKWIKGALGGKK